MKTINAHQLDPRLIHSDRVVAFAADGVKLGSISRRQAGVLLKARAYYLILTDTIIQIEPGTEVRVILDGLPQECFIA